MVGEVISKRNEFIFMFMGCLYM